MVLGHVFLWTPWEGTGTKKTLKSSPVGDSEILYTVPATNRNQLLLRLQSIPADVAKELAMWEGVGLEKVRGKQKAIQ